jgi:hypothetical protein
MDMEANLVSKRKAARMRARVFKAFLKAARGAAQKAAYAATVRFYQSAGQAWAKQLSA